MTSGSSMHAMIRPAAGRAGLDVDPEHPLEALRPRHRGTAFGWRRLLRIRGCTCRPPLPRLAGVTRARYLLLGPNTPWKRVRLTRGFGTRAASRAMKSRGSTKSPGAILNSRKLADRLPCPYPAAHSAPNAHSAGSTEYCCGPVGAAAGAPENLLRRLVSRVGVAQAVNAADLLDARAHFRRRVRLLCRRDTQPVRLVC